MSVDKVCMTKMMIVSKVILDILEIPRERVKDLTEKEKWNFAGKLV